MLDVPTVEHQSGLDPKWRLVPLWVAPTTINQSSACPCGRKQGIERSDTVTWIPTKSCTMMHIAVHLKQQRLRLVYCFCGNLHWRVYYCGVSRFSGETKHRCSPLQLTETTSIELPNARSQMTDNKEESGSKHWYTSAKVAWKGRSRSRSKGKISGASPPVTNTVFSSGTSPPSGSSKDDPNSLAPTGLTSTDAHSTHAEIQSEALPGMPEQLLVPRQQHTTAPGNIGPNTQGCRLSQSSIHGVVRDEQTLHGGISLLRI